jgi:peptidoglycan/xylan/chitin deacetylase (PgdA/CDA1 family)
MNLTLHGVGSAPRALGPSEAELWISRPRLLGLLDAVAGRDDVRLLVDDGNASDVELLLPALRDRGLRASFFVVAGKLGEPGFLSAADVRALAEAGMPIGLHGMRHRPWRGLGDRELADELVHAKRLIEDAAGRPVQEAACPFGAYDRRVLRRLREIGYARVYTSDGGLARREAWLQPRTSVRATFDGGSIAALRTRESGLRRTAVRRAKIALKRRR